MTKREAATTQVYTSYEQWNIKPPSLPARSRLFKLEPIGVGMVQVESLTSYIARLSAEHSVSPRKLLCAEVLAHIGKATQYYASPYHFSAYQINGTRKLAEVIAVGFERLTLRTDLRHMTLQVWGNVLSPQQLLRKSKAWCAGCYEERLVAEKPIYELLIWSLDAVTLCTKHNERLCDKCPRCKRHLPFLTTNDRPGYCSRCGQWLGISGTLISKQAEERVTGAELSQQVQIQHSLGELFATSKTITSPPSHQIFVTNLIKLIGEHASNSINMFSDMVGIWSGTIRRLLGAESKLSLKNLCQICSRLNITPFDLLAEQGNEEYLRRQNIVLEDIASLQAITSWNEIEAKLEAALLAYPPPSMESTARNLGYYTPKIRRHFTELCEQIVSRYKEYQKNSHPSPREIRRAFRIALKQFPPPSLQMVLRGLGCKDTGSYYYRNYLDLCLKVSKRFKEYRTARFNKSKDRKRLEAAVAEEPPPSFSEVARRFRRKRDFLRRKFPELSEVITARYKHYQTAVRKENAERLRDVIRETVRHITASGLYTSEALVKEHAKQQLPKLGRGSLFKQALREVKAEMELLS
jgi:hypothetical protein